VSGLFFTMLPWPVAVELWENVKMPFDSWDFATGFGG
jgi:hypothetical protein